MRFPFLAAEYTNICAFATFCESSAVELLTGPKVLRPCGRPPRPGAVRCAGVSPLPSAVPPDPSPLRLAVPRLTAARTSGPCRHGPTPVGSGPSDARRVRSAGSQECVHIPTSCKHSGLVRSGSRGCPRSYPFLADARCGSVRTRIGLQDMYPVARGADRACTPHPVRLESDRRETRLRAALRSPIGAAYELVS